MWCVYDACVHLLVKRQCPCGNMMTQNGTNFIWPPKSTIHIFFFYSDTNNRRDIDNNIIFDRFGCLQISYTEIQFNALSLTL